MAKKKRTAKRSVKARERRRSMKRKSKGEARGVSAALGVGAATTAATGNAAGTSTATGVGAFDLTPQHIAKAQRNLGAAVQSTIGGAEPPFPLRIQGDRSLRAETTIIPAPVPITSTVYPDSPQGPIIVQNYVTINIQSVEFSGFDKNLEGLIGELHRSNEISGEVRDQLVSELWAGRAIIGAPKPQRDLIDLLLVRPLKWLIEKSGSAMVSKLASDALGWLTKMLH